MALPITDPNLQQPQNGIVSNQTGTQPAAPQTAEPVPAPAVAPTPGAAPMAAEAPAAPEPTFKAPPAQAVTSQVAPEGETVESRLGALTEKGSKYTELARQDAIRQAASRGLINTTMAGAAGTEAAIRAALPIAQQDAQTMTETRMRNQAAEQELVRNRQAADLNMEVASLEDTFRANQMKLDTQLKTRLQTTLQSQKLSDEVKIQALSTINNIVRDTAAQIAEIGLSDRSAEQQASAIQQLQRNRDAEIAVYENLLSNMSDWYWGTEFTPGAAPPPPPATV